MEMVMLGLEAARRLATRMGPYLVVELLLPGGTLFALLLYWYWRQPGSKINLGTLSIRRMPNRL
jgi:hypothetical protein